MKPSIDERLSSVIRALSDIILPALDDNASLAKEQAQLCIAHLSIIRAQLDLAPAFEEREARDIRDLADEITSKISGAQAVNEAVEELRKQLDNRPENELSREEESRIKLAVNNMLKVAEKHADEQMNAELLKLVLNYGKQRARIDRQWFAPMGFDVENAG